MEIRTEICINAPAEKIWQILTTFEKYPDWNPFIRSAEGTLALGKNIKVRIEPPGAKGMTFKPKVLCLNKNQEFRWLGRFLFPGLFDGEHIFELIENANGTTTFIQREQFGGILVPLLKKQLQNNTRQGFEAMNQKLKTVAEQL